MANQENHESRRQFLKMGALLGTAARRDRFCVDQRIFICVDQREIRDLTPDRDLLDGKVYTDHEGPLSQRYH